MQTRDIPIEAQCAVPSILRLIRTAFLINLVVLSCVLPTRGKPAGSLETSRVDATSDSTPVPDNQPMKGDPAIPAAVRHKLRSEHHPERLLVRFRPGRGQRERQATHQMARAKRVVTSFHLVDGLQLVEIDAGHLATSLAAYAASPDVLYAEPDFIVHADVVPNDPSFDLLWGLRNIGQEIGAPGTPGADIRATEAWNLWIGDPNFKIAVIDTGVNYNHPDLGQNIWTNPGEIPGNGIDDDGNGYIDDLHGYDFVNNDGDPMDDHRHGSHTAGTIGAVGNNNVGVVGVNWQCKIVALKFLGAAAVGLISDAMLALQYAVDQDIKVSNNSWGGGGYSQAMYDTIEASQAIDHIFVAAAGNLADNLDASPHYPASYDLPNIITVAATDNNDDLASFSNWGLTGVDLGAPGVLIYSTFPGTEYSYLSGTSMAAPHVAGVVALLMSRDPTMTWQIAKNRILQTTRPVASLEGITITGGVLNAAAALGDCNLNGIDDAIDIANGTSEDCTGNGTPDECEPDCNGNSIADSCDIAAGTSVDCDGLGIPDECEPDCNDNSIADGCDISSGTSEDCNFDGVPDECQPGGTEDCDGNGTADLCDLFLGLALDCNENEIPDACDILFGVTEDCNGNLVPDECDVAPDALLSAGDAGWDFVESIADLGYHIVRADRWAFPDDLSSFEVVILGPGGVPLNPAAFDVIDKFVADGGGMIRIQDAPNYHWQYRGEARPIWDAQGWTTRTNTQVVDPGHPLAAGLPATSTLTGYSAVYTLKPEAEVVLAWDDGEAMTVYYPYGDGKVIYFNDLWAAYLNLWKGDTAYGLALMENALSETKAAELDCNRNRIPDACDIAAGTSEDCDGMGTPDECEPDCNANGVADRCDISSGVSEDCNVDGIPDDCQPGGTEDCDENGRKDLCDLFLGLALDCNENDIPDSCDILFGVSEDCNGNLVPDECDVAPDALLSAGDARSDFVESIANLGYRVMSVDRNAFPPDLSSFEVVILGPAGVPDDPATVSAIDEFVANGGGMIRIQDAPNNDTQYSGDARPILDAEGWILRANTQIVDPNSPLTAGLSTTSTLTGWSAGYTLKPEANVAIAWEDGEAMTVYYEYGAGKVIYFNDSWAASLHFWEGDTAYGLALMENALNEMKPPEMDCNRNGHPDACDIASGSSEDCTGDGTPDECEPDCNGNLVADSCDLAAGISEDCNGNKIPDECEPDCNGNLAADSCDIAAGISEDCNGNEIPDECEPDCNGNLTADSCDIAAGTSEDCNGNGIPDECEPDCDGNLIPDDCDVTPDALLSGGIAGPDFVESIADLGYRVMSVDRNAFPPDLSSFQVIILGPAGVPGDPATVSAIDEFVANGGSMIRIQDNPSTHTQYSGDARPILDATGFAQRTNTQIIDPDSPLTAGLSATSTLTGYSAVYTLKPEAEVVLAWDDGEAMTVYYPYGDGKVIYFNDLWAAYVYLWKGDTAYGLALMQNSLNETKGPELDCNRNGNPDACDIASGSSEDCSGNGTPDECEPDCNGNLIADSCDILAGSSEDCSGNGIPDECESDCNGNNIADSCDILLGTSGDCTGNWIPDECEPDCNENGVADSCDIFNGTSSDTNGNGRPDECGLVLHVDLNANGQGNGMTWSDAFADLQEALAMAASLNPHVTDVAIWIAAGTYTPSFRTDPADPRSATFQLVNDVPVYGGFLGDETNLDERDFRSNVVILSGDLGGNDGPGFANNEENAYHVVTGSDTSPTAVLDGVTITGGFAYEGIFGNRAQGAGMVIDHGSPTIVNCTLTGNRASQGAGMKVIGGSPTIANCIFAGNQAGTAGGGILNGGGNILVVNTVFSGNTAGDDPDRYGRGAGLGSIGTATAVVTNCVFVGNHSYGVPGTGQGGGLSSYGSSVTSTVSNCIFWDNTVEGPIPSDYSTQVFTSDGAVTNVDFSCVFGWDSSLGGVGNNGLNPQFIDSDGPDGIWGTPDDDFHLSAKSPCIDAGDNAAVPPDLVDLDGDSDFAEPLSLDLDGNPRFADIATIPDSGSGSPPIVDMGVYELSFCGDGVVQLGEVCDDGGESAECDVDCTLPLCGDETVNATAGEACDDGSTDDCGTCDATCTRPGTGSTCGDGAICPETEDCDDGDTDEGDGCSSSCTIESGFTCAGEPSVCGSDCNGNGVPDECDLDCSALAGMCNVIGCGQSADCNTNDIPDECDPDADGDGVPDDCGACDNNVPGDCDFVSPILATAPHDILKNRYISIDPRGKNAGNVGGPLLDIRVRLSNTLVNSVMATGESWWANAPDASCISLVGPTQPVTPPNWSACPTLHLTGCPIIPTSTYEIVAVVDGLQSSPPLVASTQAKPADDKWWGDAVGGFDGASWTPPQGVTNFDDLNAALKTFQDPNAVNATHTSVTDIHPNRPDLGGNNVHPNRLVNIDDVFQFIKAFQGSEYPGFDLDGCTDP